MIPAFVFYSIACCVALLYCRKLVQQCASAKILICIKPVYPAFCSWVYWQLNVQLYTAVQVCDARNDAIKSCCRAQKISGAQPEFPGKYNNLHKRDRLHRHSLQHKLRYSLFAGVICFFCVFLHIFFVKQYIFKLARGVHFELVFKMRRCRIAAFATGKQ